MKVIRSVIRIALIYVQTLNHGEIMFDHKSKQDIYTEPRWNNVWT
jgi:hypothetical protein